MSKTNLLKSHFPMIWERHEVLETIQSNPKLCMMFESWEKEYQEEFLDYCTGVRGIKLLYDHFFKAVMNPDITPERLEEVLSLILQEQIKILKVLPADSTRIAAEKSLLILDIVVELADGSIANVEVQKLGYAFPGQRSACYSADLLLRQYKRVKGEKGKKFTYKDIKKVYTIIFFENSVKEFHKFPGIYIHRMRQQSDTGVEIDLLQEYVFITLDIFREILHNKGVKKCSKLEAWLIFLSVDTPEIIMELIREYPEFEVLYEEIYRMCRNMGDFMGIFSEELAILDKNTVDYMIDEMQDMLDEKDKLLAEKDNMLLEKAHILEEKDKKILQMAQEIERLKK